jgi:hypothetical protein
MTRYGYFLSSEEYEPEPYVRAVKAYEQAGFGEAYPGQVGGRLAGAFEFFASQVLPRVREG